MPANNPRPALPQVVHEAVRREIAQMNTAICQLQLYIGNSLQQGTGARTIARRLSHYRHFYQFLLEQKEIKSDPTLHLTMPKHWRTGKGQNSFTVATWIRAEWDAY